MWTLTCVLPNIPSDTVNNNQIEECLTINPSIERGNGIFIANFQLKELVKEIHRQEVQEVELNRVTELNIQQLQTLQIKSKQRKNGERQKGERLKIRLIKKQRLSVERLSAPKIIKSNIYGFNRKPSELSLRQMYSNNTLIWK